MRQSRWLAILVVGVVCVCADTGASRPDISEIGRGTGVIFSPDLSPPSTCRVYEAMGFVCYREADWNAVMREIARYNLGARSQERIVTVVIETHGAHGNALKLQTGRARSAARSYASVAALEHHLAQCGVTQCIIGACNANRLFRANVYATLRPSRLDPLVLPATRPPLLPGTLSGRRRVAFFTPHESQLESLTEVDVRDLSQRTRHALGIESGRFVISDLLIGIVLHKRDVIAPAHPTEWLSHSATSSRRGDMLFAEFRAWLDRRTAQ